MSSKRVRDEGLLQWVGGSDAAFERDPVMSPAATAGLSRAAMILVAALISQRRSRW
jgi:hypothetical protein